MSIIGIHLILLCVNKISGFQFQSRAIVKSRIRKSSRSHYHNAVVAINTHLRSSFSDLSGRDDPDDKIQIMLDSFDSLKTSPKDPVVAMEEPNPIDDMVEKMATPLQFFKGKVQEKKGNDDNIIITDADGMDEKASVPGANNGKSDESTVVDTDISQSSSDPPPDKTVESSPSPTPAVDRPQIKNNDFEKTASDKNTPAVASEVSESKVVGTRDSSATTKSVEGAEESPSEAGTFRKIFDRTQTIDQTSRSTSSDEITAEHTATTANNNFKALVQTIQTSSPSLPSFALPELGSVEIGLVGGIIVIISLYLSLAAYLRGVDKDEGYAEWDQYKKKDPDNSDVDIMKGVDVDTAMYAATGAIKDYATTQSTPYGLVNKNQNPFMNTKAASASATTKPMSNTPSIPVKENIKLRKQSTHSSSPTSEAESLNKMTAQLERLDKLEKEASSVESILAGKIIPSSSGSIEVQKIEEYCEPTKVNSECSESISSYLSNLSEQQVEEGTQKAAAKQIISYLDSLSHSSAARQTSFEGTVPTQADIAMKKGAMKKGSSQTSAAFSSYLDALSTGSVKEPPSAQAVAGYLEVLSTEAKKSTSRVDSRIVEVEDRLNRLESSVASLPDNIASRLIEWQSRQDQRVNDEIEKIKTYLMDEKVSSGDS